MTNVKENLLKFKIVKSPHVRLGVLGVNGDRAQKRADVIQSKVDQEIVFSRV